ncbi:hypothetical protein LU640_25595 [Pseudomonas monteilii]|uniref:hypothetical protein n=1 Tax=Pseudomonas monteilii TaxID=76759 RepID=UPI001E4ED1E7|nr:hypothetical protein [Pseudomonas monteilii]MCE1020523.1 hypothetical protein [Pseudomonas monteilii]MCE1037909.1 hypothetical protein [Pseudomonas monteilii]MCE1090000.1 hypothetical protein [Pseudomonas monteilii]MDH0023900.1 hypothetical protein [Pseudomonas monteilii]
MKITSQQKKLWLPLGMLIVSFCMYIKALGTIWAVALVIPMIGSLMVFLICNGDRMLAAIKAWLERDGWQ